MSKKRRKKSPKSSVGSVARASSQSSVKAKPSKRRTSSASKSSTHVTRNPAPEASHKPPSKALRSSGAKKSVRGTAKTGLGDLSTKRRAASAASRSGLVEGAKAPAFYLPRDGGGTVSLSDYAGKKLVLFFYPRADTPGCTREAIDFTRLAGAFAENNTSVLGVSADPLKAQEAFRDKHALSVPLASDMQHQILEAYGAWDEKSMYGRTFQGVIRTTILIGVDGAIRKIWRRVKVDGHAEQVLAAAKAA